MEAANVSHSLNKMVKGLMMQVTNVSHSFNKMETVLMLQLQNLSSFNSSPLSPLTGENSVSPNSLPFACADAGYTINDTI
jgi:hypothetical protein